MARSLTLLEKILIFGFIFGAAAAVIIAIIINKMVVLYMALIGSTIAIAAMMAIAFSDGIPQLIEISKPNRIAYIAFVCIGLAWGVFLNWWLKGEHIQIYLDEKRDIKLEVYLNDKQIDLTYKNTIAVFLCSPGKHLLLVKSRDKTVFSQQVDLEGSPEQKGKYVLCPITEAHYFVKSIRYGTDIMNSIGGLFNNMPKYRQLVDSLEIYKVQGLLEIPDCDYALTDEVPKKIEISETSQVVYKRVFVAIGQTDYDLFLAAKKIVRPTIEDYNRVADRLKELREK